MYMADFMAQEMVPDTYDYTKLFGLWNGKGNKLYLNMTRYVNGKEWDAKSLEALGSERMKPPQYANRGNERKLQFRTSNCCKNLDENKRSMGDNLHIASLRYGEIL